MDVLVTVILVGICLGLSRHIITEVIKRRGKGRKDD